MLPPILLTVGATRFRLRAFPDRPGTYSYRWIPQTSLNDSRVPDPLAAPLDTTQYVVTIRDSASNCLVIDTINVNVSSATLAYSPTVSSQIFCTGGDSLLLKSNARTGDCERYSTKSITHAPVSFSNPTSIALGDDQIALPAISIGFDFQFYCHLYNKFTLSSNGWLSFDTLIPQSAYSFPRILPDTSQPNNMIAFAWADLNPQPPAGQVTMRYETQGTAPNRRFVLELKNVRNLNAGTNITMQLILYEATGDIEMHNSSIQNGTSSMTQGIENGGGNIGAAIPGRNRGQWDATNEAWHFSYNKGDPYVVDWHTTPVSGSSRVATGDSAKVLPPSTPITYAMVIRDASGCEDTVNVPTIRGSTIDAGPNQVILIGDTVQHNGTYNGPIVSVCNSYAVTQIPYAPLTNSSSTQVRGSCPTANGGGLEDDEISGAINIGFSFKFFCNTYTQVYISSNGWLTFSRTNSSHASPTAVGSTAYPHDMIALAWRDLDPCTGGDVRYFTTGTAPNRKFVLTYSNVRYWDFSSTSTVPRVSTQVILYEGSNYIEIHNDTIQNWSAPAPMEPLTQGIENFFHSPAFSVPGRNNSRWTATRDAWRFRPITNNIKYSWCFDILGDSTIRNPRAKPPLRAGITSKWTMESVSC